MTECYCAMMREAFLNQNVTIESAHFRNGKDADGTKGMRSNRQDLALCVTSSGSVLAMIFWYFISQKDSLLEAVLPQWKPMNVSF